MSIHRNNSKVTSARWLVAALPLIFTYSVVIVSWAAFGFFIVIKETLLRRSQSGQFIEHSIILNILFGLTVLSLITAATRSPGRPDPTLTPENARQAAEQKDRDDDIPLGRLRAARPIPERLELVPTNQNQITDQALESSSSGHTPGVSPFPLKISPFVPVSATDAGEDPDEIAEETVNFGLEDDYGEDGNADIGDGTRLLPVGFAEPTSPGRRSLFAKNSSGGVRWCQKCNGWKPDRCHHCRQCKRCTLKMDHHCVWIGNCVGHHNYKPFLLFITYGTLLAAYIFIESCLCTIHYFSNPVDYASHSPDSMEVSEIVPVTFMLLTMIGGFFAMTIGGLAGYHWYLVCNNKTTLEEMTHSYPTALIEDQGSPTQRQQWRGDELLTRPERVRLRNEASGLNVYDLGWRENIKAVLLPPGEIGPLKYILCLWPLASTRDRLDDTAGHYFPYDQSKLERLQDLTAELRLGRRRDEEPGHDRLSIDDRD